MDDMLKEALRLRRLGLAIHWLRPQSKIPVSAGWTEVAVMDEAALRASYQRGYNTGFRPGKWSVVAGKEICVLDVDIRGGAAYANEAYAAAATMLGDKLFDVVTGSVIGRHRYLKFKPGQSPNCAATTLRQSDIWIHKTDGRVCEVGTEGARPAWLIEILSTGKNVVLPPSIHPDTGERYEFTKDSK